MAFLLRAFWGSDRQKESAKCAEVVNETFQAELNNIRSSLEVGDDELQSLVEMIYDSSFPESQNFLKHPSKERLKAHKDTLSSLLFGLTTQGVPVTKLILEFTQKHGLDAIADTLITLLELVRPLLAAKEMPDFTSDDLLEAIDNQWHSSVRSSPGWGGSATQSPFQSPRGSVSMSPRGAMSLSPRSPFSIHCLSGKLSSPMHTQSLGSISPGKSASLGSYFRMHSTDSIFALPESSWDGANGTPPKRSSPSMVSGSSASLSYAENPHEENEEELNQSVRFPEISRRQEAQGSEQMEGAHFSDGIRGSSASGPSYLSSSEKLEPLEEDMIRNTKKEGADSTQNERATYGLNMNKSSHMSRRSLSFEVFKNQSGDSPVKLPAEDTQMLNAQLSTVKSARASYSLSMMKPNDSRRSLSFEVFKLKESPALVDAQNEQILQGKPSQSLSFTGNLQYSFESGVVGDKDSLSDDMKLKDKSPSFAETEEDEVDCDMGLENRAARGIEDFQEEHVLNLPVASKKFVKDIDMQLLKENEVDQRRSEQPLSDLGVAKGSENGQVAKYFRTLHVNSQESLEAAHEIGDSDQDHGAESSIFPEKSVKLDATVTLEENQVESDTFDSESSVSAGWEEKVDAKEVVTSVAGMEVANKEEVDELLEPVHKAAKHRENVESEQPLDRGIVYPLADVDVANRNDMDEESETLYSFGGESQKESAQNSEAKPHEIGGHCEDHVVGRIFASEDIAREYSVEPVEENEVKRDNGCYAVLCSDVGGGSLPVEEETDDKRVDRPIAPMDKNESENNVESVHTFDVNSLGDSPETFESKASQGDVCNTQVDDVRSVVSTTLDFKQSPQEEEDAETNNSSLHYKDDGNPVRFPVADMDHAGGIGSDEAIQTMLTSDVNSEDDSAKKPEEMVDGRESNVLAKSLATNKESAQGDTVPLKQGEGQVQIINFCNDKEAVEEEVDDKGVANPGLSSTPILVSLEESLEKVETSEMRTTCTLSKVPDIIALSEENASGKDHVRTSILLKAQSTVDLSQHQRENGEAVVESLPDSFRKKLEQFVSPGSLATPPMSLKTVTVPETGSGGIADPISPEGLAGIHLNVESSEENCHEADRNYPLQEIDGSGKPENHLGCKLSGFRSTVDVSDKGGHETDTGEACGNGNSLQTSIPASSGEELEEAVRPSSMMSETGAKDEQGSGSNINEHVIAAREEQNARVAGGGQRDAVTIDPKQQEQNVAIERREVPNTLEEKGEHKGQEEGVFWQSVRIGQEDRDLSEDEDKNSSSSSSSDSSSSATSSPTEDDEGSVSRASSDTGKSKSSSASVQSEDRKNSGLAEHVTCNSELPLSAKEDVEGHRKGLGTGGFVMSSSIDEGGGSSTEQERHGATKHFKRDDERVKHEDADFHESTIPSSRDEDGNYHQLTDLENVLLGQAYEQDGISHSGTGVSLPVQPEGDEKVVKHREASPVVHVDRQEEVEASGIISSGPNLADLNHSFIPLQAEGLQGDEQGDPVKSGHLERQIVKESDTFVKDSQKPVDSSETPAQIESEQAEPQNSSRIDESEANTSALKSDEGEEKILVRHGWPEGQESNYGVSDPETGSKMVEVEHSSKSISIEPSSLSPNLHLDGPVNRSMSWRDFVKYAYTSARQPTSLLQVSDPHLKCPAQDGIEQPATPKSEQNLETIYGFEPTTSPRVHNDGNSAPHEGLAFEAMSSEVATKGHPLLLPVEGEKHQSDSDAEPLISEQQRDRFNKELGTSGGDLTPPLQDQHQSPTTPVQVKSERGEAVDIGHRVRLDSDHEHSTSSPIRDEDDTGVEVQESDTSKMSIEDAQTPFAKAQPVAAKIKQAARNLQENLSNDQGTRGANSAYSPVMPDIGGSKSVQDLGDGHSENGSGQKQVLVVTGVATDRTNEEGSHGGLRTGPVTAEPAKMETQPAASNVPGVIFPVGQEACGSRRLQDLNERHYSNDLIGTQNSEVTRAEALESVPSSGAEPETAAREALVHPSPDDQTNVSNYREDLVMDTDAEVPDQTQSIKEKSAETREKVQLSHTSHVPARSDEALLETGESGFLGQGTGSMNIHVMDETETKVPGKISISAGSGAATREKEGFFSYPHAPVQRVELGTTEAPIYTRETETDEEANGSNSAQNVVEATDKTVSGCTQISRLAVAQKVELFSHVAPVKGVEVGAREAPLQRASVPDDEGVSGRNSAIDLVEGAHRNGFVMEIGATKREKIELFSSPLVAADTVEVEDRDPTSLAGANGIDTRRTGLRNDAQTQQQSVSEYEGMRLGDDTVAETAENMKQNLVEIPRIQSAPQKPFGIAIKDAERATIHQEMQSGSNSMPEVVQSLEATRTKTRETTSQTRDTVSNGHSIVGEKLQHMSIVEGSSKGLSHHFPLRKVENALQCTENFDASNLESDSGRWPGRALRTSVDTAELGDSKARNFLEISNGIQEVERRDEDDFDGNEIFVKIWRTSQKESGLDQLSLKHPIGAGDTNKLEISTTQHSSAVPLSTTRQKSSPLHHQPKHRSEKRQRRWKSFFCCSTPTTL